ncbi:GNAT family N-acetyltransferase [Klebsiella grimontii]|uniref:GNAT family N-acetyltransferase n=1 Tax=Klebsiella grimontii TaxID=2058152 RepID=UPI000E35616D|nr:GNAT family N-acetyltransferase [Klebsiella grimontii]RFP44384.1 N-acetyltransferase [Klebsiella oxytoca]MBZ6974725.1 GNAT family N-acetyltransferase [Klebsiella grimontii]MBZ7826665.1 GNAT family N-acetyltransferase [Klebsiella grimontii]MDK7028618.1 GNAT family N-acetyltransferase [Klebsiella grimontii]MDM4405192.1 GNAT family N-acetyltransferase [Klebsiella grimontii]
MFKIRIAGPEDAALLNEMANASYRHHFAHLWHNADELEHYLQQEYSMAALAPSLADPQCCWLIAEVARPVGFAKYACGQNIHPEGPSGTLLHKLYLLPDATGHRYGEQIFRAVETRAKEKGERWLWLEVLAVNTSARRFYERQGMQHVKDVAFHSATQESTLHILAKPI